jgi:hypothetical protein
MVYLAPTEANVDSDAPPRGDLPRGALTTHSLYRPVILGFISAYEYAICLVLTEHSDKIIARYLILVW